MYNMFPTKFVKTAAVAGTLALLASGIVGTGVAQAAGNTLTVCAEGCDSTTIQGAIDKAVSGDTIEVAAGTYNELIKLDKSVNLKGPQAGVSPNASSVKDPSGRTGEAVITYTGLVDIITSSDDETNPGTACYPSRSTARNKASTPLILIDPAAKAADMDVTIDGFNFSLENAPEYNPDPSSGCQGGVQHFIASAPANWIGEATGYPRSGGGSITVSNNLFDGLHASPRQGYVWLQAWNGSTTVNFDDNRFDKLAQGTNGANGLRVAFNNAQVNARRNAWVDGAGWAMNLSGAAKNDSTIAGNWIGNTSSNPEPATYIRKQAGFYVATEVTDMQVTGNTFSDPLYNALLQTNSTSDPDKIVMNVSGNTFDGLIAAVDGPGNPLPPQGVVRFIAGNATNLRVNENVFKSIDDDTLMIRNASAEDSPLDATNNCWGTLPTGPLNYTFNANIQVSPWSLCPANPDDPPGEAKELESGAASTTAFDDQAGEPSIKTGQVSLGAGSAVISVIEVPDGNFPDVSGTPPFKVGGGNVYLDIDLTKSGGASVSGPFTVCVDSTSDSQRLWHWESGKWVDITTSNSGGRVCGVTDSFSPFVLAEKKSDPAPTPTPAKAVLKHNKKPGSLKTKGKATGNKFKVTWKRPSNTSTKRPVTKYRLTVQVRGKKKIAITKHISKNKRSYTLTRKQLLKALRVATRGEVNRAAYTVKVRAVNAKGNGPAAVTSLRMILR